jgi:hypothetical protein
MTWDDILYWVAADPPQKATRNLERTDYKIVAGTDAQMYPIYRVVMTDGERHYIKWHNQVVDVTDRKREFQYR